MERVGGDGEDIPPFERVWGIVRRIPRGRVSTYGQISERIGRRLTPVGVGWAVRAAPEGLIPWQRVVNARGGISTDGEHPGLQRAMLEAEGVRFGADGCVDLTVSGWVSNYHPRMATKKTAKKKAPAKKAKKAPAKKPGEAAAKKPAAKKKAPAKNGNRKAPAKKAASKAPAKKGAAKRQVPKRSPLFGTSVDGYLAKLPKWQKDIVGELRDLLHGASTEITSAIKWAQPVFEHNGPLAFIKPAKNHVTLGFWRGGELHDPKGLLGGDGGRMKHLRLTHPKDIDVGAVIAFVKHALQLNAEKGNPTKRRGESARAKVSARAR